MKRILLSILLCLPWCVMAQGAVEVERFFDRYVAAEGFTSVSLEEKMMQLMSREAEARRDRELARLLGEIRHIRIVALKGGDGDRFVGEAREAVASSGRFGLLTSSSEEGQTTLFYLCEPRTGSNSELVMITYGPRETVVVDIYGAFDLKQVVRLSNMRPR